MTSTRFSTCLLVLCCALLPLAPSHAEDTFKTTKLTMEGLEKMSKVMQAFKADADAKAEMDAMGKDEALQGSITTGGSINATVTSKYPKAAAVYKSVGMTPDEFYSTLLSVSMAAQGMSDGMSDPAAAKANVDFFKANAEKIGTILSSMN